MAVCSYVYCRTRYSDGRERCPVCGLPVHGTMPGTTAEALALAPQIPAGIIDMHQIIPARDGMLELQLAMMAGLGIETALLQSVPSKVTSISGNRPLRNIRDSHPRRFIISHFMDPRYPLAIRRLRQYREAGVRVIKLLPCLGYYPDDRRWHRFFSTMESLSMTAMIHTGFITARHKQEERNAGVFLNSKYGQPVYFDVPARRYPGIQFILCHMGGSIWTRQAAEMVNQHENVWGDISGSGLQALKRLAGEEIAVDWSRLFWGNDSSPLAYPLNLRILHHHLEAAGLKELLPGLLRDNAAGFLRNHLA
ncbi:amidohydrolase family protein [bacterium]|nr:amidohydrolase family protein [bacterium]